MRRSPGKRCARWALVMLFLLASAGSTVWAQQPRVSSQLSSDTITRDETVTLTITAVGIDAELDASSLAADFDVVGRSSSREISTVLGSGNQTQMTSIVTWTLELMPRDVGVFTVPSVKVGDLETQLLSLTVNDLPTGARRDIFLTATVDTQSPWVQSQVLLTVNVYSAINIIDGGMEVAGSSDLLIERLGEDTRTEDIVDGRRYSVTQRRFAVFPQRSGELTIRPITLRVTVPADPDRVRGFFSPTRTLSRRTEAISLDVQARPPGGASWWLPARAVTLEADWIGDPAAATVDEPLTRTITLRAQGVLETQLPDIELPAIEGLSLYAEPAQRSQAVTAGGLVSEQTLSWAMIPQREGIVELPEISIAWFNAEQGQNETQTIPAETLRVSPRAESLRPANNTIPQSLPDSPDQGTGVQSSNLSSASVDSSYTDSAGTANAALAGDTTILSQRLQSLEASVSIWRTLAVSLLGLWILSIVGWWLYQKRRSMESGGGSSTRSVQTSLKSLQSTLSPLADVRKQAQQGDLPGLSNALLSWAERQWPEHPPTTLPKLADQLVSVAVEKSGDIGCNPDDSEGQKAAQAAQDAQKLIARLDQALYSVRGTEKDEATLRDDVTVLDTLIRTVLPHAAESGATALAGGKRRHSSVRPLSSL